MKRRTTLTEEFRVVFSSPGSSYSGNESENDGSSQMQIKVATNNDSSGEADEIILEI